MEFNYPDRRGESMGEDIARVQIVLIAACHKANAMGTILEGEWIA